MGDNCVCSRCGAVIGPGEYKLAFGRAPSTETDETADERITWMCRRCASRFIFDDDEDGEDDE